MDRTAHTDAEMLARQVGEVMYARERAAQGLGILLEEIRPGFARMSMKITERMLNGHDTGHGGFIFALADTAFAYSCNSHNHNTVAAGCSIEYLAPTHLGDVLTATGQEHSLNGRTGIYDIDVRNQRGELVAVFRGKAHRVKGHVVEIDSQSLPT